ncbi:MAG TPA: endopeptidase, partial [Coxiellaceae bacterium]|nr:endopeptidase [Coxiellaceae bacterium]
MKNISRIFTLIVTLFISISIVAHAPAVVTATGNTNTLAPMLKKVMPAIVNISVEKVTMTDLSKLIPNDADATKIPLKTFGVGSGVIFDAVKGLIVTNAHVVSNEKVT